MTQGICDFARPPAPLLCVTKQFWFRHCQPGFPQHSVFSLLLPGRHVELQASPRQLRQSFLNPTRLLWWTSSATPWLRSVIMSFRHSVNGTSHQHLAFHSSMASCGGDLVSPSSKFMVPIHWNHHYCHVWGQQRSPAVRLWSPIKKPPLISLLHARHNLSAASQWQRKPSRRCWPIDHKVVVRSAPLVTSIQTEHPY